MVLTEFEKEIVDALVDDFDVDEDDAKIAVEDASKHKFIRDDLSAESNAENIYDASVFWEHLNG